MKNTILELSRIRYTTLSFALQLLNVAKQCYNNHETRIALYRRRRTYVCKKYRAVKTIKTMFL